MYQPPPGQKSEQDQFPLQDTQFSHQPPVTRSPFDDDNYPADQHMPQYDHQPLLDSAAGPNLPYPPVDNSYPPVDNSYPPPLNSYPPQNNSYPPASPSASPYPQYNSNSPVGGPPTYFTPPSPNMHYGEAPRRQPRRYKTSMVYHLKIIIMILTLV